MSRSAFSLASALSLALACSSHGTGSGEANEAGAPGPASCKGAAASSCGASGESCCASIAVPGGSFYRSFDGVSTNGARKNAPATLSGITVDKFEVTVGRFRAFVAAEVASGGFRPAPGSGKHSELSKGGLNGGSEPGWDESWSAKLPTSEAAWSSALLCDPPGSATYATWTAAPGANEDHPINCVDWFDAYAFCIFDGGFLPTEAEWNYVAAGGDEQRVYPWSSPPSSLTLDCAHADYAASWPGNACDKTGTSRVGAESPLGDGKWGHADLGGDVFEWTLDWYAETYGASCDDCANLEAAQYRVIRGGSFDGQSACLLSSLRETSVPEGRSSGIGFRCARP